MSKKLSLVVTILLSMLAGVSQAQKLTPLVNPAPDGAIVEYLMTDGTIVVQGGGCSGLSYNIRFDTQPRERDRVFQFGDVRVFVDPKSFIYLHGMTLDYQETLMQQGFVFVNPNSSKSCGCGTSFSG